MLIDLLVRRRYQLSIRQKQAGEDETKNDDKKENIDRKHICRIAYGFYAIYLSITNTTGSNK